MDRRSQAKELIGRTFQYEGRMATVSRVASTRAGFWVDVVGLKRPIYFTLGTLKEYL